MNKSFFHLSLFTLSLAAFIWSAIKPNDYVIWLMEVCPVIIGFILLVATYKKFQFTDIAYILIFIQIVILVIGGHYTYAKVPFFDWLKEVFDLSRNHYDRLGHIAQGFIPALLARELLLRTSSLKRGKWLFFSCVSICLAISAVYELIEWAVAVTTDSVAEAFLAMQGDVWDTQWDMFMALCGSVTCLLILSKIHDRQLSKTKK
jgi:putative membrane protein